jgi:hypothetical protein
LTCGEIQGPQRISGLLTILILYTYGIAKIKTMTESMNLARGSFKSCICYTDVLVRCLVQYLICSFVILVFVILLLQTIRNALG